MQIISTPAITHCMKARLVRLSMCLDGNIKNIIVCQREVPIGYSGFLTHEVAQTQTSVPTSQIKYQ